MRTQATDYAYRHVTSRVLMEDMRFTDRGVAPGERFPDFSLPTGSGGELGLGELITEKPLLLVTGSYTCPMTASANPILKRLHARYGGRVQFAMLAVREAHPGERWDQPENAEEKARHAQALKERDRLPWPVLVDGPEGRVHSHLDGKPNTACLIGRDGVVLFRSLWAGDEDALARALGAVARGERPPSRESVRRIGPMARGIGTMRETMRHSGPRAARDMWRAAPPMAAMAWTADLYRPLPPQWRTAAAALTFGAIGAMGAAAVSRMVRGR